MPNHLKTPPLNPTQTIDSSVAAIVVTYNPDLIRIRALLNSVISQTSHLLVVDNGSDAPVVAAMRALALQLGFEFIELSKNMGIAAAHNVGIRRAVSAGHAFVLLLDHDSVLMPRCVAALHAAFGKLSASGIQVAAVGPCYRDETTGIDAPFQQFERWRFRKVPCRRETDVIEASVLISSGSLVSTATLQHIGHMDETLFIDGVDWEWCFRAVNHGYRIFGVGSARMQHSLGDSGIRLFGRVLPLHSPTRHYYAYRNAILLCKRKEIPPSWKLHFCTRLVLRYGIYLLFAPHRVRRSGFIFRGILDGIFNRSGPMPE